MRSPLELLVRFKFELSKSGLRLSWNEKMKPNEVDENDVWVQNNKNDMKIKKLDTQANKSGKKWGHFYLGFDMVFWLATTSISKCTILSLDYSALRWNREKIWWRYDLVWTKESRDVLIELALLQFLISPPFYQSSWQWFRQQNLRISPLCVGVKWKSNVNSISKVII